MLGLEMWWKRKGGRTLNWGLRGILLIYGNGMPHESSLIVWVAAISPWYLYLSRTISKDLNGIVVVVAR